MLSGSTFNVKCPNAKGGKIRDNTCSALQLLTIPFEL